MDMEPTFRAKKSLGQNFLVDPQVARRIVEAARLDLRDTVLEIGCGTGALTELLLGEAGRVIGVEIDGRLVDLLGARLGSRPGFVLLKQDILDVDIRALARSVGAGPLVVVGTIPYHVTSPILFELLGCCDLVDRAVLTMQREVAERVVAEPGPNYSLLALAVQLQSEPRILGHIGPEAFQPRPKVQSTILGLDFSKDAQGSAETRRQALRLAKAAFGQRRKMLRNGLLRVPLSRAALAELSEEAGIDLSRRPETLTGEEWLALAGAMRA